METNYKYWAFISYRHSDNDPSREGLGNRWADWLHNQLESYRTRPASPYQMDLGE